MKTIQDIERLIQEQGGQDLFELQDKNLWMKSEEELNAKWESDYSDVIDYEIFKQDTFGFFLHWKHSWLSCVML